MSRQDTYKISLAMYTVTEIILVSSCLIVIVHALQKYIFSQSNSNKHSAKNATFHNHIYKFKCLSQILTYDYQ